MSTLNSISFTAAGNLTTDPELRFAGTGKPVAGLRIAVTPRAATTVIRTGTSMG
jgi:single-stranded DNA-binding protein